jgi:hypothetical protein
VVNLTLQRQGILTGRRLGVVTAILKDGWKCNVDEGMLLTVSVTRLCATVVGEVIVVRHMQGSRVWDGVATAMQLRRFVISFSVGYCCGICKSKDKCCEVLGALLTPWNAWYVAMGNPEE